MRTRTATHPRKGFTLIELLLVIAIISLLVALLLPTGKGIRDMVNRARCQAQLKGLANAYMAYVATEGEGRFPITHATSEYLGDGRYANWYPQNCTEYVYRHISGTAWYWETCFGPLVWHRMITPDVLVCPAVADTDDPWWQVPQDSDSRWYFIQYGTHFSNHDPEEGLQRYFKTPGEAKSRSISTYCLRPGLYPWTQSELVRRGCHALMADNLHFAGAVLQRHVSGVNVAYFDGHIEWREDEILTENMFSNFYVPLGHSGQIEDAETWQIWASLDGP